MAISKIEAGMVLGIGILTGYQGYAMAKQDSERPAFVEKLKTDINFPSMNCPSGEITVSMPTNETRAVGSGKGGIWERIAELGWSETHPSILSHGESKYEITGISTALSPDSPPVTFKSGEISYTTKSLGSKNGESIINIIFEC